MESFHVVIVFKNTHFPLAARLLDKSFAKYIHANALTFCFALFNFQRNQNKKRVHCLAGVQSFIWQSRALQTGKENVRFSFYVISTGGHQ